MKTLLPLLLLTWPAFGQITEGESENARKTREMLLSVYNRPDVVEKCEKEPDAKFTIHVRVNGGSGDYEVTCRQRRQYLAYIEAAK